MSHEMHISFGLLRDAHCAKVPEWWPRQEDGGLHKVEGLRIVK